MEGWDAWGQGGGRAGEAGGAPVLGGVAVGSCMVTRVVLGLLCTPIPPVCAPHMAVPQPLSRQQPRLYPSVALGPPESMEDSATRPGTGREWG